ncbi:MAG: hypothetical protein ACRC78_11220 [Planktothrix sp.]
MKFTVKLIPEKAYQPSNSYQEGQPHLQDLRKFGDVTLDVGVIHELPLLLIAVMRKS